MSRVQHTFQKCVRDLHRELSLPVVQTMALQDRGDDVRLTLTRRAYDFETGPPVGTVEQFYHPDTKIAAFELRPEPQGVARRALRPERQPGGVSDQTSV